jgi:myo-inositol-1(or 4)-monophosphatase
VGVDLQQARLVAIEAAEAAGAVLRRRVWRPGPVRAKGEGDVVTELDTIAQGIIIARLRIAFPGHRIVSEEAPASGGDSAYTWVVDPLDGTNNVVIGLAAFCVGIALCETAVPVVSVVHEPMAERTWSAIRGQGAWSSRTRRLRRRVRPAGRRPLLAWTQGYAVGPDDRTAGALRLLLDHGSHRVLQLWAPLLCWVMLARGDIDGLVGYRIGEIDLHAGALIAAETGIGIRALTGNAYEDRLTGSAETRSLVAGPPNMMSRLLALSPAADRIRDHLADLWAAASGATPEEDPAVAPPATREHAVIDARIGEWFGTLGHRAGADRPAGEETV